MFHYQNIKCGGNMKIKELDELIKLIKKLQEEPDIHQFNDGFIVEDFIELVEIYKDFLHED